jgi:hypothetical protein
MPEPELIPEPLPVPIHPAAGVLTPPLLDGTATPEIRSRLERFYQAIERDL